MDVIPVRIAPRAVGATARRDAWWATPSAVFVGLSLFVIYATLWASKADVRQARLYAVAGALFVTEMFAAITFLPTGLYTDAALIALAAYVFLGLTRAHFVENLKKATLKRYVVTTMLLLVAVLGTAHWM